jgi:hypothetical protein
MSPRKTPTTTALWIASQWGHAACADEILKAAGQKGVLERLLEQTNLVGSNPCYVGVERGHAQIVGVLVKLDVTFDRLVQYIIVPRRPTILTQSPPLRV